MATLRYFVARTISAMHRIVLDDMQERLCPSDARLQLEQSRLASRDLDLGSVA
jgi:hypothetical protein